MDSSELVLDKAGEQSVASFPAGGEVCEAGRGLKEQVCWVDRFWKIGITASLYGLLFREELSILCDRWSSARESHGWLIPAFSVYFLYNDRASLSRVKGKASYLGLLVILVSLFGYVYSIFKGFFYPRQVMMITLLGGTVLLLGGWRILRIVWLPVCYLILAMPLPARLYYEITMPMRKLASLAAAAILNILPDVEAAASGVVINGTHGGELFDLNVAEACSGMRLLLAFVALGVAMAYLERRPTLHRVILLGSTIPIAIFCNMLRVLLAGLTHIYAGYQYATGTLHTVLGMVMLGVAFGLYGLLAWVMNRLYVDEDVGGVLVVGHGES